jgi:hypothetical protein
LTRMAWPALSMPQRSKSAAGSLTNWVVRRCHEKWRVVE